MTLVVSGVSRDHPEFETTAGGQPRAGSTTEFSWRVFRPHGTLQFDWDGMVIEMQAHGPFNAEFLTALKAVQRPLLEQLRGRGKPRADVVRFHGSCMASDEVMQAFTARLAELVGAGLAPLAVCYVIDAEVEAGRFMQSRFEACHAAAGIPFCVVEDLPAARAWTLRQIEAKRGAVR